MHLIRPYSPDDWAAVCRIHDRARPDELAGSFDPRAFVPLADDVEAEQLKACDIFVAEVPRSQASSGGGRPGGGGADPVERAAVQLEVAAFVAVDGSYLAWLYVDPAHYRKGLGRALLRFALERLGPDAWTISCGHNEPALALYLSEGFRVVKRSTGNNAGYEGPTVRLSLEGPGPVSSS
ncbi:MAG: GNAT family N-acetyltransferase [Planctomycetota bacterium]|nr:GNAT family N-acetyltransferase [Planctomycetota bacterium]